VLLKPLWDLVSFLGDVSFIVAYIAPFLNFLDSAWGTLLLVIVGFFLIYRASSRPATDTLSENDDQKPDESENTGRYERLEKSFKNLLEDRNRLTTERDQEADQRRAVEQERDKLRKMLNPPPGTKIRIPTAEAFNDLKEEVKQIRAERDALRERAEPVPPGEENQLDDDELKRRSAELADELFQFLEERGKQDPSGKWIANATDAELDKFNQETMRYDDETMGQYRRRFSGRVRSLVAKLKARGWWNLEDLDDKERKRLERPLHPMSVQEIAERLSAIEHL
jgi:uncharacterized protein (DUF3084 family)